jgi:hypothetical protein
MQPDRFARKIVAILALSYAAHLRQLMRNPLGGCSWKGRALKKSTSLIDACALLVMPLC